MGGPIRIKKLPPQDWAQAIPPQLKLLSGWCGSIDRRPLDPRSGRPAKVNDPQYWGNWTDIQGYYASALADADHHAGHVFSLKDGLILIDLDNAIDEHGKVKPWAARYLDEFKGKTYIEISISLRGFHVVGYGKLPCGLESSGGTVDIGDGKIEVYHDRRFCTLSGMVAFESGTLGDIQAPLDVLLEATGLRSRLSRQPLTLVAAAPIGTTAEQAADLAQVRDALKPLDPDADYNHWVQVGMALKPYGPEGLEVWDAWSATGGKYRQGEPAERWASFKREEGGVTLGTVFHLAREAGWQIHRISAEEEFAAFKTPEPDPTVTPPEQYEIGSSVSWQACDMMLVTSGTGKNIKVSPSTGETNIGLYFERHPKWKGRIKFNRRTHEIELDGSPVGRAEIHELVRWVHHFCGWKGSPSSDDVATAIFAAGSKFAYDPVHLWLAGLTWDGVERNSTLCGQLGLENNDLTNRQLRRWLIGAVARAYQPGCEFQSMLVLWGEQGKRKSKLLKKLAVKAEWYSESAVSMTDKDGQLALLGPWICENGELAGMDRQNLEAVKVFISERISRFRPPYGRRSEDHPRMVALCGTTNDPTPLKDSSGSRRFWLIGVAQELNLDFLTDETVGQIWAEAVYAYKQGERWWDEGVEVDEVQRANDVHYEQSVMDTWVQSVLTQIEPMGATTVQEVISQLSLQHQIASTCSHKVITSAIRMAGWLPQMQRLHLAGAKMAHPMRYWTPPAQPVGPDSKGAAVLAFQRMAPKSAQENSIGVDDLLAP